MAEHYRFFDAQLLPDGSYDREYNAPEFTDYFKALITTGIMKGAGNELKVTTNGSSMITKIDTGIAFILGKYYENDNLDVILEHAHDTEVLGKSRIDRIVIRMDESTEARYVKSFIKKGVASTNPVPPTLTQNANVYEISLAQVKIIGGQTYIGVNDVTDERGKDVLCPYAGSNILPNFNDAALEQLITDVNNLNTSIGTINNTLALKANKAQQNWIDIVLSGGTADTSNKPQYFKDEFGFVHIAGKIKGTFIGWQMPVGYRPQKPFIVPLLNGNTVTGSLSIQTNGYYIATPTVDTYYEFNFSYRASEV